MLAAVLAWTWPATGQSDGDRQHQNPLLPPVDPQQFAGHILFAFDEEGLMAPPSLILKDGSIVAATLTDADLAAGLGALVAVLFRTGSLYGEGVLRGATMNDGLSLAGELAFLPGSFFALANGIVLPGEGTMAIWIDGSRFVRAEIGGTPLLASLTMENAPLHLEGRSGGGSYERDGGLSFEAELSLLENFESASTGSVQTTLKAGGTLQVKVEKSIFKEATFGAISGELDVFVPDSISSLKLGGTLNGRYDDDSGITLVASMNLREPFTYSQGPVTATLQSGVFRVHVEQSDLRQAELVTVATTIDVDTAGQTLRLAGTVDNGSYKPGTGISFKADLELASEFIFRKGRVSATLRPGTVQVQLHNSTNNHWIMFRQPGAPALKVDLGDDDDDENGNGGKGGR